MAYRRMHHAAVGADDFLQLRRLRRTPHSRRIALASSGLNGDALGVFMPRWTAGGHAPSRIAALVHTLVEVVDQDGGMVMSMKPMNLVRVGHPERETA